MGDELENDKADVERERQRRILWQILIGDALCGVGFGVLVVSGVSFGMAAAVMVVLSVVFTTVVVLRASSKKKR
jgi:hypothetical protein